MKTENNRFEISRARWMTVDSDSAVVLWGTDAPPVYQNGAWQADTEELAFMGFVGGVEGRYPAAGDSLRRVDLVD